MGLRLFYTALIPLVFFGNQALYLIQKGEIQKGIELYRETIKQAENHDFEVLEQMGQIMLDEGTHSRDPEIQLLSIYGYGIAGRSDSLSVFEAGVQSQNPITQLAAVQFLGQLDDDRTSDILGQAMSSNFLPVRLEAAYYLAQRKNAIATHQLEALMYKLPPPFRVYFPEFFALIGTPKAIALLRQLMNDQELSVRSASYLSAAAFGRDDLLGYLRASATHKNPAEQEVCAIALGRLADSHSRDQLKKLSLSTYPNVRLSAHRALYQLGDTTSSSPIIDMANEGDLLAILALGSIPEAKDSLLKLVNNPNRDICLNAALALLQHKHEACLLPIAEFLTAYPNELAIQPLLSTGRVQTAWRLAPPSMAYAKLTQTDVMSITLDMKERILAASIDLPESSFLELARILFDTRVVPLIPSLVRLLENQKSDGAIALLKKYTNAVGAPLTRGYCNLALMRMGEPGPYAENVISETSRLKDTALIRFRSSPPKTNPKDGHRFTPFALTPEETSRLLIESYTTLATRGDPKSIDVLLDAISNGNPKNRYALAGLLLKTLE